MHYKIIIMQDGRNYYLRNKVLKQQMFIYFELPILIKKKQECLWDANVNVALEY